MRVCDYTEVTDRPGYLSVSVDNDMAKVSVMTGGAKLPSSISMSLADLRGVYNAIGAMLPVEKIEPKKPKNEY